MKNEIDNALREFKQAPMTWTLTTLMVLIFLMELFFSKSLTVKNTVLFHMGGAFGPSILNGEYWRLITAGFLHASVLHLLGNLVVFVWLGKLLEKLLGGVPLLLIFLNSVLAGNLLSLWLSPLPTLNIGASGGIFGFFASFIVFWLLAKQPELWREQSKSMIVLVVLSIVLSVMTPNVSVWGHVGGFIGGLIFTIGVMWRPVLRNLFRVNYAKIGLSWIIMLGCYVACFSLIWQRFGG